MIFFAKPWRAPADLRDFAVLDPEVGAVTRNPRSINDSSAFDLNIEIGHEKFPPWETRLGLGAVRCASRPR